MSTRWLTIFLLSADFILIGSDGLPMTNIDTEDKWINTDTKDINRPNRESDSLPNFNGSGASIEKTQKVPTLLNHQEMKGHRHKGDEKMPSWRKDYLIAALSKIAKVRSFEEDSASIRRSLMANVYNAARDESAYLRNGIFAKDSGAPTPLNTKLSSKLSPNGISSSNGIGQKNLRCQAIPDIYIPEIKENVPSYACTSEGKTFILSSKRFLQDRRSSLRVNIDDDTLRKLNDLPITLTNSRFNIIPTILILKPGHDNYDIRNQQSISLHEQ